VKLLVKDKKINVNLVIDYTAIYNNRNFSIHDLKLVLASF